MNSKNFQKYLFTIVLIFVSAAMVACEVDNTPVEMQGKWCGKAVTDAFGEAQICLDIVQNSNYISAGSLKWTDASGTVITQDIAGSINNSRVTVSAIFYTNSGAMIEMVFQGTKVEKLYSGNMVLFHNGIDTRKGGTFSLSKIEYPPQDPGNPPFNDDCSVEYKQCEIYCGPYYGQETSDLMHCKYECLSNYQECIENKTW